MKKLMVLVVLLAVALIAAPAIAENGESTNQDPPASDGPGAALPKAADQEPAPPPAAPPTEPPSTEEPPAPELPATESPAPEPPSTGTPSDDGDLASDTGNDGISDNPVPGDDTINDTSDAGDDDEGDDATGDDASKDAGDVNKDEKADNKDNEDRVADKDRKDDGLLADLLKDDKKDNNGKDGVEQSTDQDVESGDANQDADVINTGDNVNQCVGILQVANTGNATNANGVVQYDSDSGEVELEDGATVTISPKLVLKCRQVIRQVVKSERLNDSDAKKLRNLLQSGSGAPVVRTGGGVPNQVSGAPNRVSGVPGRVNTGAAIPTSRLGAAAPKVLSASGAGQPKASSLKSLPKTGGSYATLLGLGAGVLLIGGGLLFRRLAR